jgi:hypothetical protein
LGKTEPRADVSKMRKMRKTPRKTENQFWGKLNDGPMRAQTRKMRENPRKNENQFWGKLKNSFGGKSEKTSYFREKVSGKANYLGEELSLKMGLPL